MKIEKKNLNRKGREARNYNIGNLLAIKRTQLGPGVKMILKFLGPYWITKVKSNYTYDIQTTRYHDGPAIPTCCNEYLKPWVPDDDNEYASDSEEPEEKRSSQ